eukprot:jgi/Mesen1/4326/ME000022S03617
MKHLQQLRKTVIIVAPLQVALLVLSLFAALEASHYGCSKKLVAGLYLAMVAAALRLLCFLASGLTQAAAARAVVAGAPPDDLSDTIPPELKARRRSRYKRWMWWSRVGTLVAGLQIVAAAFLSYALVEARDGTQDGLSSGSPSRCPLSRNQPVAFPSLPNPLPPHFPPSLSSLSLCDPAHGSRLFFLLNCLLIILLLC